MYLISSIYTIYKIGLKVMDINIFSMCSTVRFIYVVLTKNMLPQGLLLALYLLSFIIADSSH